jgi:hypothetical protein
MFGGVDFGADPNDPVAALVATRRDMAERTGEPPSHGSRHIETPGGEGPRQ